VINVDYASKRFEGLINVAKKQGKVEQFNLKQFFFVHSRAGARKYFEKNGFLVGLSLLELGAYSVISKLY